MSWNIVKRIKYNELGDVVSPASLSVEEEDNYLKNNHLFPICLFDFIFTSVRYWSIGRAYPFFFAPSLASGETPRSS